MPYALTNQLSAALVKLRQAPLDASVAERAATAALEEQAERMQQQVAAFKIDAPRAA